MKYFFCCLQDSWDVEEEEKKDEEKVEVKAPVKTKPNKALKAKLAEQEVIQFELRTMYAPHKCSIFTKVNVFVYLFRDWQRKPKLNA